MVQRFSSTLVLCATASVFVTPCHAQSHSAPQMAVNFSDLDVSKPVGAQILLDRIKSAAQIVCGNAPDLRDLDSSELYKNCVNKAVDDAVRSVGQPLLADLDGNPELVADAHPKDMSQATGEVPFSPTQTNAPSSNVIAMNPTAPDQNFFDRIGSFFSGLIP